KDWLVRQSPSGNCELCLSMAIHCAHCAHEIELPADGRRPPWCSHCGADLKTANALPAPALAAAASPASSHGASPLAAAAPGTWEQQTTHEPLHLSQPDGEPWDGESCNACGTQVEVPDWSESSVASCPECGQCLLAPKPWTPSLSFGQAACLSSVRDRSKYPGSVGVVMGSFAVVAAWSFPGINVYAQWAATLLGAALLAEGLGRIRAQALKQRPRRKAFTLELPQEMPDAAGALGSLQAIFHTHNSWGDSLAILLLGLAIAFGGLYLLDWLGAGFISAKLVAAAVMAPVAALYMGYRAVRNLLDRRRLLVFLGGLIYIHGSRINLYPWDKVSEVTQQEIG